LLVVVDMVVLMYRQLLLHIVVVMAHLVHLVDQDLVVVRMDMIMDLLEVEQVIFPVVILVVLILQQTALLVLVAVVLVAQVRMDLQELLVVKVE
jgi:hypothetical protein